MPSLVPPVVGGLPAEQPVLTAGDLVLRPWRRADAPALVAAYADPVVQHWHGERLDLAEAQAYAERWAAHWKAATRAGFAMERRDEVVGRATLRCIDLEQGSAELTYWVLAAVRGQGLATRAVERLVAWAFEDLGLHRLTLIHSTLNAPSCRVATKCGFDVEGTARQSLLHDDGWHDMHLHARLAGGLAAG